MSTATPGLRVSADRLSPCPRPRIIAAILAVVVVGGLLVTSWHSVMRHEAGARHYETGLALYSTGDFAGAQAELEQAVRLDPDGADAQRVLGQAHEAQGNLAEAAAAYEASLAMDSEQPDVVRSLGAIRRSRSRAEGPEGEGGQPSRLPFTSPVSDPTTQWVRQFGTSSQDSAHSVAVDATGDAYCVGMTFGPLPGETYEGAGDAFIRKYGADGAVLWTDELGTSLFDASGDLAVDASGNVVGVGTVGGTLPGQSSAGGGDCFMQKYSSGGAVAWTRQFGTSGDESVNGTAIGGLDNLFAMGATTGTFPGQTASGDWDAFVRLYDLSGDLSWTRQFGTSAFDEVVDGATDSSGTYLYAAGWTGGDLGGQGNAGGRDAFVRKYSAAGTLFWTRQFGSPADDNLLGIAVDSSEQLYGVGWTAGSLPGQSSSGARDAFIRKYDADGNVLWTSQFGTAATETAYAVALDPDGDPWVAGWTSGTFAGQSSSGGIDAFFRKYSSTGTALWTSQFGSSEADEANGVALDARGAVHVSGLTVGTLPGQSSAGSMDAYLLKLAPDTVAPITSATASPASPDGANGWYVTTPTVTLSRNEPGATYYQWDSTSTPGWTTYSSAVLGLEGTHTLYYFSADTADNTETVQSLQLRVDTVDPGDPGGSSSSHATGTPSEDNTIEIAWTGASDLSSGVDGFSVSWSAEATEQADSTVDLQETATSTVSPTLSDADWYFNLRTKDNAGNWTSTVHMGPLRIQATGIETEWIRQTGNANHQYGYQAAGSPSGDALIVGDTGGVLPGQTSAGGTDAYLLSYAASGSLNWGRQFGTGDEDSSLVVLSDPSGDIYVAADTMGTFPGQVSAGTMDTVLRRYDSSGNVVWTRQFGTSGWDFPRGGAIDSEGNVYVSGTTEGTFPGQTSAGGRDAFLRKYTSAGAVMWTRQYGTSGEDIGWGAAVDSSGSVYVSGRVQGALPGQAAQGDHDAFLQKYSSDGGLVWARQLGTSGYDDVLSVQVDSNDSVYVAGFVDGALPGQTALGQHDAFVRKYDSGGNAVWTRQFGSSQHDEIHTTVLDSTDRIYVAGFTAGALPGQSSFGGDDAFVRLYDGSGNAVATRQLGTSGSDHLHGSAMCTPSALYVAGFTNGAYVGQVAAGGWDIAVLKLSRDEIAPSTGLEAAPSVPDGANAWYRSIPTITLSRDEPGSTYYQWDSTSTPGWIAYSSAISGQEGSHTLYYFSADTADNTETAKSRIFKVDTGLPTTATLAGNVASQTRIDLAWTESADGASGVSHYEVRDASTGALVVTTAATSYSHTGLPVLGQYSYRIVAVDSAGNTSTASNMLRTSIPPGWNQPMFADFEPNDTSATALPTPVRNIVPSPHYYAFVDDATDEDWYRCWVNEGQTLDLSATVQNTGAEIAWQGYFPDGSLAFDKAGLGVSESTTRIAYTVPSGGAGYYTSRIFNRNGGAASTRYEFDVKVTPQTDTLNPTPLSNVATTAVNATEISLTWTGSTDDRGPIGYGVVDLNTGLFLKTCWTTSTMLTNLSPDTTYYLGVGSFDAGGNLWAGVPITVRTSAAPAPESLSSPYLGAGAPTIDGSVGAGEWASAASYTRTLTAYAGGNPQPMTYRFCNDATYLYVAIESGLPSGWDSKAQLNFDGDHNHAKNGQASSPQGDFRIGQASPSGWSGYSLYMYQNASLGWDAAQGWDRSVARPAGASSASSGSSAVSYEFRVPLSVMGVSPGATVGFTVGNVSPDAGQTRLYGFPQVDDMPGRVTETSGWADLTLGATDSTPPTAPSILSWTAMTTSSVTLQWSAATDDVGVTGYAVYDASSGTTLTSTSLRTHTRFGLTPGATYRYYVKAYDAAGNLSAASSTVQVTLPDDMVSDPIPPGSNVQTSTPVPMPGGQSATVTVGFDEVTSGGTLDISVTGDRPNPHTTFKVKGLYYDISFSGTHSGYITITLPYDPTTPDNQARNLKLRHWTGSTWEDCTVSVDTVNHTITGRVGSLSPFGVFETEGSPTGVNALVLTVLAISLVAIGQRLAGLGRPEARETPA